MALPLLMLAGAGILGGTQYLMKRQDQKRSQSMFADLQSQVANSALDPSTQSQILARAQSAIENDSFWNRGMVSSQIGQLQDGMINANEQARQAMAGRQIQGAIKNAELSFQRQDQLDADYNRDLSRFAGVQSAYQKAVQSTAPGANTADKIASLYNFFSIIDPGRAVQGNEAALFDNIGGLSAKGENWWRSIFGKGVNETTQQEIMQAVQRQYLPEYNKAVTQRNYYDRVYQNYWDRGYSVISPTGSLGIDFTPPGQDLRNAGAGGGGGGGGGGGDNSVIDNGDGTVTIQTPSGPVTGTLEKPEAPRLPPGVTGGPTRMRGMQTYRGNR